MECLGSIAPAGCARRPIWLRRNAAGVVASVGDQDLFEHGVPRLNRPGELRSRPDSAAALRRWRRRPE